jgi:hypothetical protein
VFCEITMRGGRRTVDAANLDELPNTRDAADFVGISLLRRETLRPSVDSIMKRSNTFVAECFWPDVTSTDLEALDRRVAAAVAALAGEGQPVGYLGSILVDEDEVVLCQFEGSEPSIRLVAERAAIPFARILETTSTGGQRLGVPNAIEGGDEDANRP